jgi:sugar phosphate permease
MSNPRELRNGAALVGIAWLAFIIGSFLWSPVLIWTLDQATAAPRGVIATGSRAALGVIGGVLAGLASGYLLDTAWRSRWQIACAVLVAMQYTRATRIGPSAVFDALVTFLPGLLAGVAAFLAFPLGRRWNKGTTSAPVA